MSATLKFGAGSWAAKEGSVLAYNDENNNFKPLPFTFTRASSATRVNESGLIESVASGVPRIDFLDNADGHLLLEPSRTNSLTYSEELDNAAWTKLNLTIESNTTDTLDPSGYNTADKITDDATNASHIVVRYLVWDTTQRTASVYAKAGTSSKVSIRNASLSTGVYADLSAGTIVVDSGFTGTITSVGNGWYRITATHTASSSQTLSIGLFTGTSTISYAGTGSYAYIWGAQVEAGSYATSYIPTSGSSVTRVADAASQIVPSGVIGQTEGTLFIDTSDTFYGIGANDIRLMQTAVNDTNTAILIYYAPSTGLNVFINNGTASVSLQAPFTLNQRNKVAVAYKNGEYALALNGSIVDTDSSAIAPPSGMNQVSFVKWLGAANTQKESVNQALLYNTRLSNSELAALTS